MKDTYSHVFEEKKSDENATFYFIVMVLIRLYVVIFINIFVVNFKF